MSLHVANGLIQYKLPAYSLKCMVCPWWTKYVGIPYKDVGRTADGCDCYGLVRLVYARELQIFLPTYDGYLSADDMNYIAPHLEGELHRWTQTDPQDFAVVLWIGGKRLHIGVMINETHVLHTGNKVAYSVVQPLSKIYGHIDGIYKWEV